MKENSLVTEKKEDTHINIGDKILDWNENLQGYSEICVGATLYFCFNSCSLQF